MTRLQPFVFLALLAALSWAQDKNQAAPASPRPASRANSVSGAGAISEGVYRNPSFGFSYKLPYGWVDRTREMQDDSPDAPNNASKSLLLVAIFERPPEAATSETVNSAVVIAAEPLSSYSGMKTAADYFGPLTELATAKGFQAVEQPRQFSIGYRQLLRGDFTKPRGTNTVLQTSLVMLERGYEVSFTFIGGSQDEISELIEKLSFGAKKTAH